MTQEQKDKAAAFRQLNRESDNRRKVLSRPFKRSGNKVRCVLHRTRYQSR